MTTTDPANTDCSIHTFLRVPGKPTMDKHQTAIEIAQLKFGRLTDPRAWIGSEASQIVAAYLEAVVACGTCNGTGWADKGELLERVKEAHLHQRTAVVGAECPEPHTVIEIDAMIPEADSEPFAWLLYADPNKVHEADVGLSINDTSSIVLPLPEDWKVADETAETQVPL